MTSFKYYRTFIAQALKKLTSFMANDLNVQYNKVIAPIRIVYDVDGVEHCNKLSFILKIKLKH